MALVKYNNNSLSSVTSAAGFPAGALTHIKTLTASSSSNLSFVHGSSDVVLDSTYPIYVFKFINMHPADNDADFQFNMTTDSGSNYNVTKTTTLFRSLNHESDSTASVSYQTGGDLAQSTSGQRLTKNMKNANDDAMSGIVRLFNPSSTTFVKHFMTQTSSTTYHPYIFHDIVAGYGNTTSAIDAVQFEPSSGTIDSGTITLYGIR
mgnify:CR=1 FL=1